MDALSVLNKRFFSETMFELYSSFCVLLCSLIFDVSGFITKHIARLWDVDKRKSNSVVYAQSDDDISSRISESDRFIDKGFSEFSFKFEFGTVTDLNQDFSETECSVSKTESSVSKYQFMSGKDVSGFIQGPEKMSFSVEESYEGFIEKELNLYNGNTRNKDFEGLRKEESDQFINLKVSDFRNGQELILEPEFVYQDHGGDCSKSSCSEEGFEESDQFIDLKVSAFRNGQELISEPEFVYQDHGGDCSKSSCSEEGFEEQKGLPSEIDELFQNIDEGTKGSFLEKIEELEEIISTRNSSSSDDDLTFNKFTADDIDDDFIELEPNLHHSLDDLVKESPVEDLHDHKCDDEFGMQPLDGLENSDEPCLEKRKSWEWESDEEDEEDILMEHKYLIEQMKMESKHSRNGGLPTILEESETPKISEDLKPLQIDETFEHSDRMEEIQKFYKSYSDKMRKMDILNYQTMHAISFIRLKEPVKLISSQKSAVSAMKTMFLPNFNPGKLRKIYADQTMKKSMIDLHKDLERVYVGQVCVSWEILHWQYTKAHELQEHNSQDYHTYNQVAGEFQQFQVLLQRFIEDELFQGPRVQNYVSKRHSILSLLQVPIIKDDCFKDKTIKEDDAISIAMLKGIIEESMRVFWEFLRADKHEATLRLKRFRSTKLNHQDAAADSELLMDIKSKLQKKEKRLKEVLRNSNCIVKKLQKHQGSRVKHDLLICQVELRLISRVLHMSRCTADQLIWCQSKLNNIYFVNRKFSVEPSFLLFPC